MSDKIYSIPETAKAKSSLAEGAVEMFKRQEAEREDLSTVVLKLDGSNKVSFPDYPYLFEAKGEKVIVSIDIFKSGYECKVCKGKKRFDTVCECERFDHPGTRYSADELDRIRKEMGDGIADARALLNCASCNGDYISARSTQTCSACKGRGALLHLPDSSKNLPTTGVVVSMGPATDEYWRRRNGKPPLGYGIGHRVLFGPYAGNMIPTKAGIAFKIIDADNVWCIVEGANDMGQFDFILQDDNAT